MFKNETGYTYSPSDLNAFLDNECVTWLDRYSLDFPDRITRDAAEEGDVVLQKSGDEHERKTLDWFRSQMDVAEISKSDSKTSLQQTMAAMRKGRSAIYQARLVAAPFAGLADFLVRVPGSSDLGDWHYEVYDTKLARSMKSYFPIQLCCYSEMLETLQGRMPEKSWIVLGNSERVPLRLADYLFYYRSIKQSFLEQQRSFQPDERPHFTGRADYRHWTGYVSRILDERDDLSRVANIRAAQIEKLTAAGITTMNGLAQSTVETVPRMNLDIFNRLRSQARLQVKSADGTIPYEILPGSSDDRRLGFDLLPPPSPGDIAFDIEGYPLMEGGLEYLLGVTYQDGGQLMFKDWWAHDQLQERIAFEGFVDWVYSRWQQCPSMHVYHYAAYEVTALNKLIKKYGARKEEVDELLRNHVFVDLYTVVRQSLLVGQPSYSLKKIEHLYLSRRAGDVATAGDSIVYYFRWLTVRDGEDWQTSKILRQIRDYNKEDCDSTWLLIDWLRDCQAKAGRCYVEPKPPHELAGKTTARAELATRMLACIPTDKSSNPEYWRVYELFAHLVEFHRREQKPLYGRKIDWLALTEEALLLDPDCLGGIERTASEPVAVKRSFLYEYRFPRQETKLSAKSDCFVVAEKPIALTIESIDYEQGLLTIKRAGPLPDRFSLIPDEIIRQEPIPSSIEHTVRLFVETDQIPMALDDFLYRRRPRIKESLAGPLLQPGEDILPGAKRLILGMDRTSLCIQGPPGSGKTTKCAQVIAELLKAGKRVGISSNSHDVISHLMKSTVEAAVELGASFAAAKCGGNPEPFHPRVEMILGNTDIFKRKQWPSLVGGTAWVFSHEDAVEKFDYLFVDEAGQVSLANLVGMARSASNLIFLGDQMQLSQPIQGVHSGESGASILDYYLQKHATVPEDLGLFLPTSWRMRPEICTFISSAFYEGRLQHEPHTESRNIRLVRPVTHLQRSSGIAFVPVSHQGRVFECEEEVRTIQQIVGELLGQTFEQAGKASRAITKSDILIVAPYNLQVRRLRASLPGVRVGTVDKFQGQEAPVVIFSMTASEGDSAPRGVGFLFDRNRLNVAISRAQVLAVIVGSPKLEITRCSGVEQMQLVNLFCRAVSIGSEIGRGGLLVA